MKSRILDIVQDYEKEAEQDGIDVYKLTPLRFILRIMATVVLFALNWCVIMNGYNWVIPNISNLQPITLPQAGMIDLLITFIVNIKTTKEDFQDVPVYYIIVTYFYHILFSLVVLGLMYIVHLFI